MKANHISTVTAMSLPRLGQQSQAVPWESPSEIALLSDLPVPSDGKFTVVVFCGFIIP
jgi:hypothetical protein